MYQKIRHSETKMILCHAVIGLTLIHKIQKLPVGKIRIPKMWDVYDVRRATLSVIKKVIHRNYNAISRQSWATPIHKTRKQSVGKIRNVQEVRRLEKGQAPEKRWCRPCWTYPDAQNQKPTKPNLAHAHVWNEKTMLWWNFKNDHELKRLPFPMLWNL